jgi:hypothetical protein
MAGEITVEDYVEAYINHTGVTSSAPPFEVIVGQYDSEINVPGVIIDTLKIRSQLRKDKKIEEHRKRVAQTNDDYIKANYKHMINLRKREIAFEAILSLIEKTGPVDYHQYVEKYGEKRYCAMQNLLIVSMGLASGVGSKFWPIGREEWFQFFKMNGHQRKNLLTRIFEEDKLGRTTRFEYNTGLLTYETYKANGGELNREEFQAVRSYVPSPEDLEKAMRYIRTASLSPPDCTPTDKDIETAARIIGALGNKIPGNLEKYVNSRNWLFAETHLVQTNVYGSRFSELMGRLK